MNTGDIIFSYIGTTGNPISSVTEGYRGARVNHMGIIVENTFGTFVLEAFPPEVRLTHMDVFTRRSNDQSGSPRLMLASLKNAHVELVTPAIQYGLAQRDIPYDQLYLTGEGALYCSELVVDMFKHANDGSAFFPEEPMSFSDNQTGEIHEDWIAYYAYFGMTVPQGQPGSNPGGISLDSKIEIYDVIGEIPGYV